MIDVNQNNRIFHFKTSINGKFARNGGFSVLISISILIIVFLIIYPNSLLIMESFGLTFDGKDSISLEAYREIFSNTQTYNALKNSIILGIGTTLFSLSLGVMLAWLVCRTDFPFKKFINWMVFLSFIVPHYILGISWIEIFGRNGYLNRILSLIAGHRVRFSDAYSLTAVIIVMGLHLYPMVFMAVSNALRRGDPRLEEAALLSGAGKFRVFKDITLPLMFPTLFSMGLFVFSRAIANFGVSALLLVPIYEETLTTRVFYSLNDLNLKAASSLSMVLVGISGLVFLLQYLLTKKKKFISSNSVMDKSSNITLGKFRKPVSVIVCVFLSLTSVLPILSILLSSFLKRWGLPLTISNMTFKNYTDIFTNPTTIRAFANSFLYGSLAAVMAIFTAVIISYLSLRSGKKGMKMLSFFSTLPMAIPNTVLAIAAVLAWSKPPFEFYSTPWILIITYSALFLPICMKNIAGLMENIDPKLEEAARVSGANALTSVKDVLVPLILPGIKSGFILSLLIALREIPISMMLHTSGTETVGVLLFNMRSNSGSYETTSAIAVIIITLCFAGRLVNKKGKKRRHYGKLHKKCKQKIR